MDMIIVVLLKTATVRQLSVEIQMWAVFVAMVIRLTFRIHTMIQICTQEMRLDIQKMQQSNRPKENPRRHLKAARSHICCRLTVRNRSGDRHSPEMMCKLIRY